MNDITKAEIKAVLTIVKSPEINYNANSLSKSVGITPMGALKILKRLENEGILLPRKIGKAVIYRIDTKNDHAKRYVHLMLSREALHASPQVKHWIYDLKKLKNADMVVLFGSVLHKADPRDIDVLLVTDQNRFSQLQKEINMMNNINIKQIHPMYQTYDDIISNLKKKDPPLLNAIKGIVASGHDLFIEVYDESRKE